MIEKDIKILKIVHRGLGLGHRDNKTFLIYYALPEEIIDAEIIMTKKSYSIGRAINIKNLSPFRITPLCSYYQTCGGCQLLHADYNYQIKIKKEVLKELLKRSLKQEDFEIKCIPSHPYYNYRLRAQFLVKDAKLGFTKFKSNEFVRIDECFLCHKKINDCIKELNNNISITNLNRLFIATDGKAISTYPIKDYTNRLELTVNNHTYILKPQIFFQANIFTLDVFQNEVIKNEQGISAIDFYAGSGFFTLTLARSFEHILAIEEVREAVLLLKSNLKLNNIRNAEIINSSVENTSIPNKFLSPDLAILDPPRSGMSKKALTKVLNIKPKRIIYVSCDPATLSRDVSYFFKNFYDIEEITIIDQFPHTFHFETIVKMSLKKSKMI